MKFSVLVTGVLAIIFGVSANAAVELKPGIYSDGDMCTVRVYIDPSKGVVDSNDLESEFNVKCSRSGVFDISPGGNVGTARGGIAYTKWIRLIDQKSFKIWVHPIEKEANAVTFHLTELSQPKPVTKIFSAFESGWIYTPGNSKNCYTSVHGEAPLSTAGYCQVYSKNFSDISELDISNESKCEEALDLAAQFAHRQCNQYGLQNCQSKSQTAEYFLNVERSNYPYSQRRFAGCRVKLMLEGTK